MQVGGLYSLYAGIQKKEDMVARLVAAAATTVAVVVAAAAEATAAVEHPRLAGQFELPDPTLLWGSIHSAPLPLLPGTNRVHP